MRPDVHFASLDYSGAQTTTDGRKEHVFVANTHTLMRSRRRLNPAGWDFANYLRNPVLLENHDWQGLPIGSARPFFQGGNLMVAVAFSKRPRAQEIELLVEEGTLRAVSAGWLTRPEHIKIIREGDKPVGLDFERQELVEVSIVTIPDDANALKVASLSIDAAEELRSEIRSLREVLKI